MYNSCETNRFYRAKYPKKDDVVIVRILERSEHGYNVELLEYNKKGFVTLRELSRRTRHRKKNIVSIGDEMPMSVVNVDPNKDIIDLSKRYINNSEVDGFMEKYRYDQMIYRIGIEISNLFNNYTDEKHDSEDVFESTIWSLYDETPDMTSQERFKYIVEDPKRCFSKDNYELFGETFIDLMSNNLKSRITKKNCRLGMDVRVLILDERGIDSLKEIFDLKDQVGNFKLTVSLPAPPVYNLILKGKNEEELKPVMESLQKVIEERTKERGGLFNINDDIKVVKESEISLKFISNYDLERINLRD